MSFHHSPRIVTDDLVLYLDAGNPKSYPGSGTDWTNLTDTSVTGSLSGPTFDNSNMGSLVFDGVNDYVVFSDATGVTDFSTTDDYTVEFWVYLNETQNNTEINTNSILEKWAGGNPPYSYVFRYDRDNAEIQAIAYSGFVEGNISNNCSGSISHSVWNNVCAVFDWTNSKLTLYKNGTHLNSLTLTITGDISNTELLYLGRRGGGSPAYVTGNLSQLKIYNRALTEKEILQNFNALRGRFGI